MTQNKFHSESGLRYYREFRFFNVTVGISSLPKHGDSERSIGFLLQNYSKFISFAGCYNCLQDIMKPLTKIRSIEVVVFDIRDSMFMSMEQAVDLVNIACRWNSNEKNFFMTCDAGCGRSGTALLVLKVFEKFFETTGDIDLETRVEYSWESGLETGVVRISGLLFIVDILAKIHRHENKLYGFDPSLESDYEYLFVENFLRMLAHARNLQTGDCSDKFKDFNVMMKAREVMNLPAIECISHFIDTIEKLSDAVEQNNIPKDTTKIVVDTRYLETVKLFKTLHIVDSSDLEIIILKDVGLENLIVSGCPVLREIKIFNERGIENITVSGCPVLCAVKFKNCNRVKRIEISGSFTLKNIYLNRLEELVQFFPDNVCETFKVFKCYQLERLGREGSLFNNTLRGIHLEECESLVNFGNFPALETMHLKNCTALTSLKNYESLRRATIENCPLQYINFQESRGLDSLEILYIISTQIMLFGIVDFKYTRYLNNSKKIKFDFKEDENDYFYNINEKVYSNLGRGNIFFRNSSEVEVIDVPKKDRVEILNCAALEQVEFMRRVKEITIKNCPVIKYLDFRQTHDLRAVILDFLPSLTKLILDDCVNLQKTSVKNCLSLQEISIINQ